MYRLELYRRGKLFEVYDPITFDNAQYRSKMWKKDGKHQTVEMRASHKKREEVPNEETRQS